MRGLNADHCLFVVICLHLPVAIKVNDLPYTFVLGVPVRAIRT